MYYLISSIVHGELTMAAMTKAMEVPMATTTCSGTVINCYNALQSPSIPPEQEQVFRVKKLVGRRDAPELELLANNFPVYVQ